MIDTLRQTTEGRKAIKHSPEGDSDLEFVADCLICLEQEKRIGLSFSLLLHVFFMRAMSTSGIETAVEGIRRAADGGVLIALELDGRMANLVFFVEK